MQNNLSNTADLFVSGGEGGGGYCGLNAVKLIDRRFKCMVCMYNFCLIELVEGKIIEGFGPRPSSRKLLLMACCRLEASKFKAWFTAVVGKLCG